MNLQEFAKAADERAHVKVVLMYNPRRALAEALRAPGPCLIHAPIATQEQVLPMVPPGAANTEMILSEA